MAFLSQFYIATQLIFFLFFSFFYLFLLYLHEWLWRWKWRKQGRCWFSSCANEKCWSSYCHTKLYGERSLKWSTVFRVLSARGALEIEKWTRHFTPQIRATLYTSDHFFPSVASQLFCLLITSFFGCFVTDFCLNGIGFRMTYAASVKCEKMAKNSFFLPSLRQ